MNSNNFADVLVKQKKKLSILNLNFPELKKGHLLIKIKYSGICHTQLNEISGILGKDKYLPHCIGHEGVGEVVGIGSSNSKFKKGFLNCAEIYLPGKSKKEILFSTYICHPSMANNELSGPILSIFLSKWLKNLKNRKWSYRFIFVPETIGSIAYLSKNFKNGSLRF